MNKYERLINELSHREGTNPSMKVFGNSMLPIIKSGSLLTFKKEKSYQINDIVFCKVKGRYIDAHKITKTDGNARYMIANNGGYENGWTKTIFGRVIRTEKKNEIREFKRKNNECKTQN